MRYGVGRHAERKGTLWRRGWFGQKRREERERGRTVLISSSKPGSPLPPPSPPPRVSHHHPGRGGEHERVQGEVRRPPAVGALALHVQPTRDARGVEGVPARKRHRVGSSAVVEGVKAHAAAVLLPSLLPFSTVSLLPFFRFPLFLLLTLRLPRLERNAVRPPSRRGPAPHYRGGGPPVLALVQDGAHRHHAQEEEEGEDRGVVFVVVGGGGARERVLVMIGRRRKDAAVVPAIVVPQGGGPSFSSHHSGRKGHARGDGGG